MSGRHGRPDRREFLALGIGALAVATLPRSLRGSDALVRRRIPVMGTTAEVAVRHRDGAWAQKALDAAFAELRRIDRVMSRFRPDSDVGRVNAARGGAVAVSGDTAEVLAAALAWADASAGRFDPCLGRFAEVDGQAGGAPPAGLALGAPGAGVAGLARFLELDRGGSVPLVRLHHPDAAVDLGGIAKGYAVDLAARALRERGAFHALVNAGGDLVAMGVDADGDPWRVGVRDPDDPSGVVATLRISDGAVATSGTYARGAHLLDPRTGRPVRSPHRSLTVQAVDCMAADAAATAAFGAPLAHAATLVQRGAPGARIVHSVPGGPPWTSA